MTKQERVLSLFTVPMDEEEFMFFKNNIEEASGSNIKETQENEIQK